VVTNSQDLPARFGNYYLYDLIGRGGMAEIFLAKTFTGLGVERQTVIKRILPELTSDRTFGEMLINEAKLCARLSHANAVQTYDLGVIDNRYYIAMEYVEGFDLNRLLGMLARARLALPLQFALYVIRETLMGLDYAHRLTDQEGVSLGIIHRDVSPTNVLISVDGDVKVCDFGIAKVTLGDMTDSPLDEYHLQGKVAYMAPEHLNGEPVDHRADLYAAGILLWELLSGRRLYKSKDEDETLRRAKAADAPPIADRGFPEFERLSGIVSKALARDPDDRFQSGQELIAAIDEFMISAGLVVSQLKLAEFITEHFGQNLMAQRREREVRLADLNDYREQQEDGSVPAASLPVDLAGDERASSILAAFDDDEEESFIGEIPSRASRDSFETPFDALGRVDLSEEDGPVAPARRSVPPVETVRMGKGKDKEKRSSLPLVVGLAVVAAAIAAAFYFFVD
jgi:eukaryotic-like serine/threonine-protein kinase